MPQIAAGDLAERLRCGDDHAIDVRSRSEWEAEHIPGVGHIPAGFIPDHAAAIPRDRQVVVHCQSGALGDCGERAAGARPHQRHQPRRRANRSRHGRRSI